MLKLLVLVFFSSPLLANPAEIKVVIGKDERYQVKNHPSQFYKAVGLLDTGTGLCTATLISPRHILTNGHCVTESAEVFPSKLISPDRFTFTPGKLNEKHEPFGTFRGKRIETFLQWVNKGDIDYDVAVIELDKAVPLAFVRLNRIPNAKSIKGSKALITGYPGDKNYGTMWEGRGMLTGPHSGALTTLHNVDTFAGTSGAIIRREVEGKQYAVGIHRGGPRPLTPDHNEAVLFTPVIHDAIVNWVKK